MACVYIEDGFTLDAVLEPRHGFPAVKISYRLAHPGKVYAYLRVQKNPGKQFMDAASQMLLEHLVSWDVTDRSGNEVRISEITLRRIAHPVLERMLDAVTGYGPDVREADEKN